MGAVRTILGAGAIAAMGAAAGAHVWARHIEIHQYRLRQIEVEALPAGAPSLRVLHLSDAHLLPDQHRKLEFLRALATLEPDLVVDTGDNISSAASIGPLAEAIEPLLRRPGGFVMGSNDMFAPMRKNPLRYLLPDARPESLFERTEPDLPVDDLAERLSAYGWHDLTNARARLIAGGVEVRFVGVDDPHLERDEMPAPESEAPDSARAHGSRAFPGAADGTDSSALTSGLPVLRIAVAHAPYQRVLDGFVADGADLILAGHTHGGQLRAPGFGAIVTNCDLPRRQAKGLSSWRGVPLHVSGGMGASPYSNFRFANPPEATLLTLRARSA